MIYFVVDSVLPHVNNYCTFFVNARSRIFPYLRWFSRMSLARDTASASSNLDSHVTLYFATRTKVLS